MICLISAVIPVALMTLVEAYLKLPDIKIDEPEDQFQDCNEEDISGTSLTIREAAVGHKCVWVLNYGEEKHHCLNRLDYNISQGGCEFDPPFEEQVQFLRDVFKRRTPHVVVLPAIQRFFNSRIGRSVKKYLDSDKTHNGTAEDKMINLWFHSKKAIQKKTAFEKTFLGAAVYEGSTIGFRSWMAFTWARTASNQTFQSFPFTNVAFKPWENSECFLSGLEYFSLSYTRHDCNNRLWGRFVPGTSFYLDLALFTIAGYYTFVKSNHSTNGPKNVFTNLYTFIPSYDLCQRHFHATAYSGKVKQENLYFDHAEYCIHCADNREIWDFDEITAEASLQNRSQFTK